MAFLVVGAFWFLVGTIYGMFSAIHLASPEFFSNIPWLVFGRTRPVHVNTMVFGFVAADADRLRRSTTCPRCCARGSGRSGSAG